MQTHDARNETRESRRLSGPGRGRLEPGRRIVRDTKAPSRAVRWVGALALSIAALLALADAAEARGRGRGFRGGRSFGGFYSVYYGGFGFPYGYGYLGYGPHHARGPEGGLEPALARAIGLGGLDLNVKPRSAEVFVDGQFVGKASDLDGQPSYLWLEEGAHTVTIYKGGYVTFEEGYTIQPGIVHELRLRLVEGPSVAPGESSSPAESDAPGGAPTSASSVRPTDVRPTTDA